MIHILLIVILAAPGAAGIAIAVTLAVLYRRAVRDDRNRENPWRT